MFKPNLRAYAVEALNEAHRRGDDRGESRVGLTDPRHAPVGERCSRRTRSSGAPACTATSSCSRSASSWSEGTASASARSSTLPDHPEVYVVGDIAAITDAKTDQVLPQLGSVALQSGEHVGETIAQPHRRQEDEAVQVPATRARWRDRARRGGRPDARREDHEGQEGEAGVGAPCTSRSCRRTRTARRRWSTGPAPGSRTSAPAGSRSKPTRNRRSDGRCTPPSSSTPSPRAGTSRCSRRMTGTVRFDIKDGKKDDRWLVVVKKGDIVVSRRNVRSRRVVIRCERALVERICHRQGERDGGRAARRGGRRRRRRGCSCCSSGSCPGPSRPQKRARRQATRGGRHERRPRQDPRRQHLRRQRRPRRHRGVADRSDRPLLVRHALPLDSGC